MVNRGLLAAARMALAVWMVGCSSNTDVTVARDAAVTESTPPSPPPLDVTPVARGAQRRQPSTGGPVPVRVWIMRAERTDTGQSSDVSSALLDGDSATTLRSDAPVTLRLRLDRPRHIVAVNLVSTGARVEIATSIDGEPAQGHASSTLVGQAMWQQTNLDRPTLADVVEVRWSPTEANGSITEIELWAEGEPGAHVAGDSLASELVANASALGRVSSALSAPLTVSPMDYARDPLSALTRFRMVRPERCVRTFLRYELEGTSSFQGMARTLNGVRTEGSAESARSASATVLVEEISPAALREGENSLAFEPLRDAVPQPVRIRTLDVVCVEDPARRLDDAQMTAAQRSAAHALSDRLTSTTAGGEHGRTASHWAFGVSSQIQAVSFFANSTPVGTLELAIRGTHATSRVMVPLAGRRPGWNTVEVPPGLPPSDAVDVRFTGALEAANTISELHFVASPLPAPRTPRVVITTPAAADCVGNNIYVRGFVDRAGQAIDRVQLEYGPAQRELT
ncbi:MAG: hypothetical protein Q8Q09_01685, partial [Deltaproteobacteria bacterium]|nr:hypothetical protein [Deltaproteobacteria bacterium]